MRPLPALLIALALPLSGCLAPEDAAVDTATAPATLDDASAPEGHAAVTTPVDFDGSTTLQSYVCGIATPCSGIGTWGSGAFACAGNMCYGFGGPVSVLPDGPTGFEPEVPGTLSTVNVTLTWDAASPDSEELLLGLGYETDEGIQWETMTGTSPLTLHLTDLAIPEGTNTILYVWTPCQWAVIVAECHTTPQGFAMTGELVSFVPEDSSDA